MKFKLLILLVLTTFLTYGQLTVANDSIYLEFNPSTHNDDMVVHNSFIATNAPVVVKWELYQLNVPATWTNDVIICDWENCRDISVDSLSLEVPDGKQSSVDVHFINDNNIGLGTAKILIYELLDSANTFKILTYVADVKEGVGLIEDFKTTISIFPNPASSSVYINLSEEKSISKISIYNIIGKKVKEIYNINKQNTINVSGFNNGLYIIKLFGKNEELFHTQSFVKK